LSYSQSVTIDFEPERIRKAFQELLASLEALLNADELTSPSDEAVTGRRPVSYNRATRRPIALPGDTDVAYFE
jgi:hypothetical protein